MIVIDPGHGGFDPGGGSNELWKEKDLTLDISEYQFKRFEELGIPVGMTRYTDKTLTPTERTKAFNDLSNKSPNAIGISNHINKNLGKLDGAEVYHSIYDTDALSQSVATELKKSGQNIRYVGTRQGQNGDYYFIIRNTRPTQTILVEYGFADSPGNDINLLLNNKYELAEAVVKAVAEYQGYNYTAPKGGGQDYILYEVENGDSLYRIARLYNVPVTSIKNFNGLTSDVINKGDFIKVPLPYSIQGYEVQNGDSIYKIAQKFNTSVKTIQVLNQIDGNQLNIGETILVPEL